MKMLTTAARRAAKSLVPMGAVKVHTKGNADIGPDGVQPQSLQPFGLTND